MRKGSQNVHRLWEMGGQIVAEMSARTNSLMSRKGNIQKVNSSISHKSVKNGLRSDAMIRLTNLGDG